MKTDREIVSTRSIPVEPERIFKALTQAEYLAAWWGPKGFRNTFHEFEPSTGGAWNFDMHSPEGETYTNKNVFEAVEPERIVIQHLEPVHCLRTAEPTFI